MFTYQLYAYLLIIVTAANALTTGLCQIPWTPPVLEPGGEVHRHGFVRSPPGPTRKTQGATAKS
jgi:hypothetical protein